MTGTDSRANLVALVEREMETAAKRGVDSLPLVELPADRPSRVMAVLVSGDGGWRDLDKTIGEKLQALGVPVVGWDSLRYFWSRKTPEQTTRDLAAVLAAYGAKWRADKFVLIGYSFGADVLPVVYNMLPAAYRDRVAMISLLGLEPKADWEIRVAGWFGAQPSETATPLAPEFAKIPGELIQCYYGVEEKEPWLSWPCGQADGIDPNAWSPSFRGRLRRDRQRHSGWPSQKVGVLSISSADDNVGHASTCCRGRYQADAIKPIAPRLPNPLGFQRRSNVCNELHG